MGRTCLVVHCGSNEKRDNKRFFRIPAILSKGGPSKIELSVKRRQRWVNAIRRSDLTETKMKYGWVCEDHFIKGMPADLEEPDNPDWVPSKKMGYGEDKDSTPAIARYRRVKNRKIAAHQPKRVHEVTFEENEENVDDPLEVETMDTPSTSGECESDLVLLDRVKKLEEKLQSRNEEIYRLRAQLNSFKFTEESFCDNDEKTRFFTGLTTFKLFKKVIDFIAPYITVTPKSTLDKFQQILLTLMPLRLNLWFKDLSYRFGGSSQTTSRVFYSCLSVMHARLHGFILWPSREALQASMPPVFVEAFGHRVTVIVDCFEVFIEKPSNLLAAAQTWSNYKHHNTVKYLIGITPQGVICFISEAWCGRTSDKYLTENSGFLDKLIPHDLVLADRGFLIGDSVRFQCAELKVPAFTKGKNQLSAHEVEETRKIASVRIHVERVIGSLRQKYEILQDKMPISLLVSHGQSCSPVDQIVSVCCALTNLCPSVVSQD